MVDRTVVAERRQVIGKQVRKLRREGIVPANIYGHRKESVALQMPRETIAALIRSAGSSAIVEVAVDGEAKARPALIKFVQRHAVTDEILHVDFYQVSMTEKMTLDVPLVMIGDAPAVKDYQGVLLQLVDNVSIRCLPTDLPQHLEVDISGLAELESSVHISDVKAPSSVEILNDPEQMVVRVETPRIAAEIEAEEAAAAEAAALEAEVAEGEEAPAEEGEAAAEAPAAEGEGEAAEE
jgi:large subunit ribosomal protein L25